MRTLTGHFRNVGRVLAVAGLCVVVIPLGMADTGISASVPDVDVSARMTSMTVSFATPVPTRAVLALNYGSATGLQVNDGLKTRHVFKLSGLQPAAAYRCSITTVTMQKEATRFAIPCATKTLGPAKAEISGGSFHLDGAPTFLLGATARSSCPDEAVVDGNRRLGIFVMSRHSLGCPGVRPGAPELHERLHDVLKGKMLWHEMTAEGATLMEGLPELVDFPSLNLSTKTYLVMCGARSAEPLYGLIRGKDKPVMSIIPVATRMTRSLANCIDVKRLEVLFWTAVAAGAGGIHYVTLHPWDDAAGVQVKPDLIPAVSRLSREIAVLGPALLTGRRIPVTSSESSVKAAAFTYGGATYVIASNTVSSATSASFFLSRGGNHLAVPIGGKGVRLKAGRFSADFGPFDVTIFRIDTA